MYRCCSGFLLSLAIISVAALTGCLGKSTGNSATTGVASVTLNPGSTFSMNIGASQVFSATAKNAGGSTVLGINIQFVVTSGTPTSPSSAPAPLSIAGNGNSCAGTWDPTVSICSPGTSGIATIYAIASGVFSAPTIVYVHQPITSIAIRMLPPLGPPPPNYPCFSQGQTRLFQANALSNNVDVTDTVGPMTWTSSNSGVLTATTYIPPNQINVVNEVQVTAKTPGITQLVASVSGASSAPYEFTTCFVQAIYLQIAGQGPLGNSTTVNTGASLSITATAIDSLYQFTGVPMPNPPLTWSTTNPDVALFGTTTNTTGTNSATARINSGEATLTASCTPPTCNIGLPGPDPSIPSEVVPSLPIYASVGILPNKTQGYGAISVNVIPSSTAKLPTYTAWVATTDCQNASGCSSALFSMAPPSTPGANPISTILSLPRTPNSLVFNHQASPRLYIGSDQGLMYLDVASTSAATNCNSELNLVSCAPVPCNVSLCGTVLTTSNDGKFAVISNPPTASTPSQVYIFDGGSNPVPTVQLTLDNPAFPGEFATAASFSPDQLKLFILTNAGNMYVYSTVDMFAQVPPVSGTGPTFTTPATDVKFSADGSFAYVAGALENSISAYSTCSLPGAASVNIGTVATANPPVKVFPSPMLPPFQPGSDVITQNVFALEVPANGDQSTSLQVLTANFTQDPIGFVPNQPLQFTCNQPTIPPFNIPPTPLNDISLTPGATINLGQGNFTPLFSQLVANGTELILVAPNISAVLVADVTSGTTTSVPLVNNAVPFAAASSTDGSQVYVAACDQYVNGTCTLGQVHIVNTSTSNQLPYGDYQQVPYINVSDQKNNNMCNGVGPNAPLCVPNLIAIRPQ
jgi:hypothetical protein